MKISRTTTSHRPPNQTSPELQEFLDRLGKTQNDVELLNILHGALSGSEWSFGKTDLHSWIPILDRLDTAFGLIIEKYKLHAQLQETDFEPEDLQVIMLSISSMRILLESCSSRNLFNSYDRLNCLLRTSSLDVLEAVLDLLIVPARKLDSHKTLRNSFKEHISLQVIEALTGYMLQPIADPIASKIATVQVERMQRKLESERSQLTNIRLISTFITIMMSPIILSAEVPLFNWNPSIVTEVAQLIGLGPSYNEKVSSSAMLVLRSFLRYEGKLQEVSNAMRLSSPHGPIIQILADISKSVSDQVEFSFSSSFYTSFVDLFIHLAASHDLHPALLSSGALSLLCKTVEAVTPVHYKWAEKVTVVLENLINKSTTTFEPFLNMDGLHMLVKKISSLVKPFDKASGSFLAAMLRVIERLLVTFANEDRMRNLVETALFDSLRLILIDFETYPAEIQSHCIAIIAAFIHNEPTSLSILQERKVPQSMIDAVCRGIPVDGDVISGLLLAFGASCLNAEGEQYFQSKNPLKRLLSIFLDPKYSRALIQHGNASIIGQSMDEFIRHHPPLGQMCIDEIMAMIKSTPQVLKMAPGSSESLCSNKLSEPVNILSAYPEQPSSKQDNPTSIMLECICVFLEPIMLNEQHSSKLIQGGIVDALVACLLSSGLGLDYPSSPSFHTLVHLFHRLSEVNLLSVLKTSLNAIDLDTAQIGLDRLVQGRNIMQLSETVSDHDKITFDHLIGMTNLLAVLYDSCSMLLSNALIQDDQEALEREGIIVRLEKVMQIILRCHHQFISIESSAPRSWFATAMQSPLPFSKGNMVFPEKFSEYADPADPRVKNVKLMVAIMRNSTLCGSLIFTALYKLFSGSSAVLSMVATEVVNYAESSCESEKSQIYPIQFLTFAVTIWNTVIGEQAAITGYVSPDSLVKLIQSLAFEKYFALVSNLIKMSTAEEMKEDNILAAWKSCFTLTFMTLSKITNPKSFRHHFMDDMQVADRSALAKCLSVTAGFCSFMLTVDAPLDETGYRLLINVIDHLVAKDSDEHTDDLSDLVYSVTSGHFIFYEEASHGKLKSLKSEVSERLMDYIQRSLAKFPKLAIDFGNLLAKFKIIVTPQSLAIIPEEHRFAILSLLMSQQTLPDNVVDDCVKNAIENAVKCVGDESSSQALLCLQSALSNSKSPDISSIIKLSVDALPSVLSPSHIMAILSLLASFIFHKKAEFDVDQLIKICTANTSYLSNSEIAFASIPNLQIVLLRLCLERTEKIDRDLIELEMLERFSSWSFPQQAHLIDRFGPLLLRDKDVGFEAFKSMFKFEGPGIIPNSTDSLRKQIDAVRLKLQQHQPSDWSQKLILALMDKILTTAGNDRIILLSLFSELIGAYEFLRGTIIASGRLGEFVGTLLTSADSSEMLQNWTVQFMCMFVLPPSAHISSFEKADSVATYSRPIIDVYISMLKTASVADTKLTASRLKTISEQLTLLLSISSADEVASKMVTLTMTAQLIDQKAVVLLANALKSVNADRDAMSPVISLMELLARFSGRFKSKQKSTGQHVDDKMSVADLEEAFGSSDMITDIDMMGEEEGEDQDDVDMDILEEEGALEDHDMDREQLHMDDMEAFDEIIDTSDGEFSDEFTVVDDEEDDEMSDDSDYDDGYEITYEPEGDSSGISSDIDEDEFVFEVDPADLRNLENNRNLLDLFMEPSNAHRSHDVSSIRSEGRDSILSNDDHDNMPDFSSDFDDEDYESEDGDEQDFVDLHIDIPVTRRRSSGLSNGSMFPRGAIPNFTFAARAGRNAPQFNISTHPMLSSGPFMISGNAFDERMRPVIEPRSDTKGNTKPAEKTNLSMFEKPFFVSTVHRWEQLVTVVYGKHAERVLKDLKSQIEETMAEKKSEEKVFESKGEDSEDVVLDSEDFTSEATSSDEPSSNNEEENVVYEDPGIDPSFLSAVPFDMLEEVLDQYFAERRINVPPNASITINAAFLASLAQPVRDLYVRMSEEEDENYRNMPESHRIDYYLDSENDISDDSEITSSSVTDNEDEKTESQKIKPELPAVKESSLVLVDNAAIGTIISAYLSPLAVDKKIFFRLLTNLAKQTRSCADILGLLVYLLEESPTNQPQLDWALENYLTRKRTIPGTPKAPPLSITGPKRSNPPSRPSSAGPSVGNAATAADPLRTGPSPVFYVQRLLQLLTHLCLTCATARDYFMTKSDRSWTIKRHGKNATFKTDTRFPVALLIAAFESPMLFGHGMLTEQLLRLLHTLLKTRSTEADDSLELPGQLFHSFAKSVAACELSTRAVAYAIHIGQGLSHLKRVQLGFVTELVESTIKLSDLAKKHLDDLSKESRFEAIADPMSPHSKCLRVLKVLAAVVYSRPGIGDNEVTELTTDTPNEHLLPEAVALIKQHFDTVCLNFAGVESHLQPPNEDESEGDEQALLRASALLPCIECFFVCCRLLAVIRGESHLEQLARFAEKHRKVLNSLVRSTPSLLTVGSLRILTRTSKFLDFDNKRVFFRHQLHRRAIAPEAHVGTIQLNIRREHIFEDSYRLLMSKTADEVRFGKINVKFHGEDGVDAGGVTREWLMELSKEIFNPDYALFRTTAADRITYQPNRASAINPDHLQYFKFVGRIIGKALFDNRLLDCYFTRSFYKHMLGIPVDFKDLEAVDLDYYKSLNWMLENDITDLVEQTFAVDTDEFGVAKTVDLKPNGRDILVTEANKREYVQLLVEYRLHLSIKPQIDAFLSGLYEIIPLPALKIFNEQELELLISGLPDIDIDDWRVHTELTGYLPSSPQIQWFWRCVRAMDVQERTQLIQFVTGTSKVPLEGFAKLQGQNGVQLFQIHRDYGAKDRLPSAHTCFNQLDLPEYESYEQLRDALMKAVKECSTGFGLA